MSRIGHFQVGTSPESEAANTVLQLVGHIYRLSSQAASELLTEITEEPIDLGMQTLGESAAGGGGPDGWIRQRSFQMVVDARIDTPLSLDTARRHASSMDAAETRVLLLLSKEPLGYQGDMISALVESANPGAVFCSLTYGGLCGLLRRLLPDRAFAGLIGDFEEYCAERELLGPPASVLRVIPAGRIADLVAEHGVWFQPAAGGSARCELLGMCRGRKVRTLLDVKGVVDIEAADGRFVKTLIAGEDTDEYDPAIQHVIKKAKASLGLEISKGYRFHCGGAFPTEFKKSSPGGLVGTRVLDLREMLKTVGDAADSASRLSGKKWS